MIQTQAYVTRKEEIQARAPKYKGNMALAEQEYLNEVIGSLGAQQNAALDVDNASLKTAREKVEKWTNLIFSKGIVPGSKEHDDYEADLAKLDMLEKTVSHGRSNLLQMQSIDKTNPIDLRTAADSAVSSVLYQNLTGKLAQFLAFKNADVKVKPDPFALSIQNSNLSLQRAQIMESIRQTNRVKTLEKRKELGLDGGGNKNGTVIDPAEIIKKLDNL